jgi:nucleotide-binding universal stress UspA family protein
MTAAPGSAQSILVALDESERAPFVFATAVMMARNLGAQLCPMRVLVFPPDIPPAAHTNPLGMEDLLLRDARSELHALMTGEPGVRYGPPVVVPGDPWRQILETAVTLDVDLIVIGSHRHYGAFARALGTVASSVVNRADRNVLVVHQRGVNQTTARSR